MLDNFLRELCLIILDLHGLVFLFWRVFSLNIIPYNIHLREVQLLYGFILCWESTILICSSQKKIFYTFFYIKQYSGNTGCNRHIRRLCVCVVFHVDFLFITFEMEMLKVTHIRNSVSPKGIASPLFCDTYVYWHLTL
jgi:hypothetical protein